MLESIHYTLECDICKKKKRKEKKHLENALLQNLAIMRRSKAKFERNRWDLSIWQSIEEQQSFQIFFEDHCELPSDKCRDEGLYEINARTEQIAKVNEERCVLTMRSDKRKQSSDVWQKQPLSILRSNFGAD